MSDELRKQVAQQCKAVAHMAAVLGQVHADKEKIVASGAYDRGRMLDTLGRETARYMEQIGDILIGMDAVTQDDEWVDPIFEEAQRLWPNAVVATGTARKRTD